MPRVIRNDEYSSARCYSSRPAELEEVIESLRSTGFDANDETSLVEAAAWLHRLERNRTFFPELLVAQLKAGANCGDDANAYTPQSIMLSKLENGFFLRANIWPAAEDHCFRASGARGFVYGTAHDHNFDFLTVGYFGPGYVSDYYEYEYDVVAGWCGEQANLKFVERGALTQGKIVHYRALRDVHNQIPPDSLSVSINIMSARPEQGWMDQYGFDTNTGTVSKVLNPGSSESVLRIAVALGNAEALNIAGDFSKHHPSDRMRLTAYEARAMTIRTIEERDALWREAEMSPRQMLSKEATTRRRRLAQNRGT